MEKLSKEAKQAAAEMFHLPDPDVSDSTTASESEIERLERYPEPLSPRSASRKFHERISEAAESSGPKIPKKRRTGSKLEPVWNKLFDGVEESDPEKAAEDRKGMRSLHRPSIKVSKYEGGGDVGMGGVVVDFALDQLPGLGWEQTTAQQTQRYLEWQVMRKGTTEETNTPSSTSLPLSNMGLFALLPGELRNRIYRSALVMDQGPWTITIPSGTCHSGACVHSKLSTAVPGILSACQQIRSEAMPIYCAENTFSFDPQTVRARCPANWLRCIGHYGRLLRHVYLQIRASSIVGDAIHYLEIECPASGKPQFTLQLQNSLATKNKQARRLHEHIAKLNTRVGQERMEQLLLEFVWSDLVADLLYRCEKELGQ